MKNNINIDGLSLDINEHCDKDGNISTQDIIRKVMQDSNEGVVLTQESLDFGAKIADRLILGKDD